MVSQELTVALHSAIASAKLERHKYVTLEHLMLEIAQGTTASELLLDCNMRFPPLYRGLKASLSSLETVETGIDYEPELSLSLQRAMARAQLYVERTGHTNPSIKARHVLWGISRESNSIAVKLLNEQGITEQAIIDAMAHAAYQMLPSTPEPQGGQTVTVRFPHGEEIFEDVHHCANWLQLEQLVDQTPNAILFSANIAIDLHNSTARNQVARNTRLLGHVAVAASALGAATTGGILPILQGILGRFALDFGADQTAAAKDSIQGRLMDRLKVNYPRSIDLDGGALLLTKR